MNCYHKDRYTGHLTCTLETSSPLYVRCGVTPKEAAESEAKDRPDFFYTNPDAREPVIPGSSLRGMLRNLIEIVSYSKMQPVDDKTLMTFRAVAGQQPLATPYQRMLGKYGRNVKAGYVAKRGDRWYIEPAFTPSSFKLPEKDAYLTVKYHQIVADKLPGFVSFRSSQYKPQYHKVSFDIEIKRGKRGRYVWVTNVTARGRGGKYKATLVGTGNMAETTEGSAKSPRKRYALVLPKDPKAKAVPIAEQAVEDYRASLTDFQKKDPFDEQNGCLIPGRPIFYVERGDQAIAFGHCPNFRIPAWLAGSQPRRAAKPLDFVPPALRDPEQTDLAEALFGYVDERAKERDIARAGRISVTDATLLDDPDDVWLTTEGLIPQILGTPKPTTFQHYLVQQSSQKSRLRHYGSPTPEETVIRGHKLYWHKGDVDRNFIEDDEFQGQSHLPENDTQHTVIKPVRSGVHFQFQIHFENASVEELGALLWLLDIAADEDYRLKLGMTKPLGLGAVKVESSLHLTEREERYTRLFDDGVWATGEDDDPQAVWDETVAAFETWLLKHRELNPDGKSAVKELTRIQMLLALLSWPGPDREETRYLQIEPDNEYSARHVLPTPLRVLEYAKSEATSPAKPPGGRQAGHVKWFNDAKGYGFINVDGQDDDVFVHYTAIQGSGHRSLNEGERVEFETEETPKGLQAKDVKRI